METVDDNHLIIGKKYKYIRTSGIISPQILKYAGSTLTNIYFYKKDGRIMWFIYDSRSQARKCWIIVNYFKFGR